MRFLLALGVVLGVALGAAAVVYGESDDSPGLQLIGVLIVISTTALAVRGRRPTGLTRR
jgi:hypothetical protein